MLSERMQSRLDFFLANIEDENAILVSVTVLRSWIKEVIALESRLDEAERSINQTWTVLQKRKPMIGGHISTAVEKLLDAHDALRNVGRAAKNIGLKYEDELKLWVMHGGENEAEALQTAFDTLPQWVKDEIEERLHEP